MDSVMVDVYDFLKQGPIDVTVLATLLVLVSSGFIAQYKLNATAKIKRPSLKKLPVKRHMSIQPQSHSTDPQFPSQSTSDDHEEASQYVPLKSEGGAGEAIINTILSLKKYDLTNVSTGEFYEVISRLNPTIPMTSEFLSAVTDNLKGHQDLDWGDFLRKHDLIERYRNNAMSRSSAIDRQSNQQYGSHRDYAGHSPRNDTHSYKQNVSATLLYQPGPITTSRKSSGSVRSIKAPASTEWVSATQTTPAHQAHKDSLGRDTTHLYKVYVHEDNIGYGALHPEDTGASKRLEAWFAEDEDAAVCTIGHPLELELQAWRLVSKNQILRMKLFADPEEISDQIPDQLYITFNALHFLMHALPDAGSSKGRPSDDRILEALLGFSGNLGHEEDATDCPHALIDAEYLSPYLPWENMHETQKRYWKEHQKWKEESLRDIGITLLKNGRYWTAGEEHFYQQGWDVKVPMGMRKRKQ